MKKIKSTKAIFIILCIVLFLGTFAFSASKKYRSIIGFDSDGYTLQNSTNSTTLSEDALIKEIVEISYIRNNGTVDKRPIIIYRPKAAKGDLPLVYIPHYDIKETSADFQAYINHGWAVASPTEFMDEYNGELVTDSLVFNNAALYTLRNMDGIDRQRIAIVGGSAGGYTTMMITSLQLGTCVSIANSPITNIYYTFAVHFLNCDEVNLKSGIFDFPITIQGRISRSFRPINDNFKDSADPLWAALSPSAMARCISNPVVINHYTSDILVPVDQITKRYSYPEHDGSLPADFPVRMGRNYPGILSRSFEEEANPKDLLIQKFTVDVPPL